MVFQILKILLYYKVWGDTKACSSQFYAVVMDEGEGGWRGSPKWRQSMNEHGVRQHEALQQRI